MMHFVGIRSEGGLLPPDILEQIAQEKLEGQKPTAFGLSANRRLTDEISRAWSDAQDYWNIFRRRSEELPEKDPLGTTLTRERWISRLLQDLLGYELTRQESGVIVNGKNYPISHRAGAGEESPPVHIEGFKIDLDQRPESRRLSPQALVQEYLNNSDTHLWGIVTNGTQFRLLRDTSRTSRPSYLEFNLQSILEGNNFNEFALFYRVCHRTRLPKTADDSSSCLLEKYFQISIEQGGRVRDHLRDGVEEALKILGTALLQHPKNHDLCERAQSGRLTPASYHRQLLRLVYRLLFLMVAEERRMILPEAPESERRWRIYSQNYSVHRLRTLAEKHVEKSTFADLWLALKQAFRLFEDGDSNPLGIPPLNGDLFSSLAIRDLQETHLYNDQLLAAMRQLSLFRSEGMLQRINYSALDVEELGSVYESLLDFQPVIELREERLHFDLRTGSERKSTGSYYTRPELVAELISSALVPVMEERLAEASKNAGDDKSKQREAQIAAIVSMTVCDPACGSGHFLLAAARRLGRELAKIRTGEEEPTPKEFHLAVRDVISHCIYGVDLNPLAVDLCKLALWLEGHWTGKPLSFLDHHIKCGNSLIGVLDPAVLAQGIPDEAFNPVTGDNKEVAKAFKKKNKDERRGQPSLPFDADKHVHDYATQTHELNAVAEETPADVKRKAELYHKQRERKDWWHDWTACNLWTAVFFLPLTKFDDPEVPTQERFLRFVQRQDSQPQMAAAASGLAEKLRFFHWHLEFPEVFKRRGFDVVLGNPPWEKINVQEKEFFKSRAPDIANAGSKSARQGLIGQLKSTNSQLWEEYQGALRNSDCTDKFLRGSGRFHLTAIGDINTYSIFAEHFRDSIHPRGRAGLILPIGIATDENTSTFFSSVVDGGELVQLLGFENESFIFPTVHHSFKFCAFTLKGKSAGRQLMRFAFFCRKFTDVQNPARNFYLDVNDFSLLSPNTRSCPVFRSGMDAVLTSKFYRRTPVLENERLGLNPWRVSLRRMFHMSDDSSMFRSEHELLARGLKKAGRFLTDEEEEWAPLYEAKMIHQYDHRFATYDGATQANLNAGILPQTSSEQKQDPDFSITSKYWAPMSEVLNWLQLHKERWLLAYRKITRDINERTGIFTILSLTAAGDSLLFIHSDATPKESACLLANLNSIPFDYVLRQKIGGSNLAFHVLRQLPVLEPSLYQATDTEFILSRVLELLYTATDLQPFAGSCGFQGQPFRWDDNRRTLFRAELDAYYAHLYGLTRDELRYILDPKDVFGPDFPSETFRVLKDREQKDHGEYRTRRLVLEAFDELAESPRFRDEMPKRVSAFEVPHNRKTQQPESALLAQQGA